MTTGGRYCYPQCRDPWFNECADCWRDGGNPGFFSTEGLLAAVIVCDFLYRMTTPPTVPTAWIGREDEFPWPEWERTCPGCGRYTRHFHFVSGESCRCAYCGWMGDLPETAF